MSFTENFTPSPSSERLGVVELPPPQKIRPEPTPEQPAPPVVPAPPPAKDDSQVMMAVAKMLMVALSARALLAFAFLGAFLLGGFVIWRADWLSVVALLIYCVSTIAPITLIELAKRP